MQGRPAGSGHYEEKGLADPNAAAPFIAAGNEPFHDCDLFTWSSAWTGYISSTGWPAIRGRRLAITSLTFRSNCLLLPVIWACAGN